MCRVAESFLVTKAERKHVRQRARFQQHGDVSSHQVFFHLQGKAPKEIYAILTEILGKHDATVNNWVPRLNMLIFPPLMLLVLDDTKH